MRKSVEPPDSLQHAAKSSPDVSEHSAAEADIATAPRAPTDASPTAPVTEPDRTLGGRFRLGSLRARGRLGSVYAATEEPSGARCIVKILERFSARDAQAGTRLLAEAHRAETIVDAYVATTLGAGHAADGRLWIATELLEGATLAQRMAATEEAALTPAEARRVLLQLTLGLSTLHRAGITHRDLRPSNVFLSRLPAGGWRVKLIDHCVSHCVAFDRVRGVADAGPEWIAPECLQGARVGPAADLWSLGLLAFWLFTGRSYWADAQAYRSAPVVPASQRAAEYGLAHCLPEGFDPWFARCVARAWRERFPSAHEASRTWSLGVHTAPAGADARGDAPPFAATDEPSPRTSTAGSASLPPPPSAAPRSPSLPPSQLRSPTYPGLRAANGHPTAPAHTPQTASGSYPTMRPPAMATTEDRPDSDNTGPHALTAQAARPPPPATPDETPPTRPASASVRPLRYTLPLVAARRLSAAPPRPRPWWIFTTTTLALLALLVLGWILLR